MFKKLKQFMVWLNTDESSNAVASTYSDASHAPEGFAYPYLRKDIEHDEIIQDKLRVLKRSGLALPFEVWPEFVVDTVVNFALWCQDLPASENYHHSGKRGLLLHSLDVAIYAMRLRRNYILPPNTAPEEVIHREIVWVYGVFLCALLHDAGKVLDMDVELYQKDGEPCRWTPALGPITAPYRYRYYKDRQYATHQHNGLLLLNQLLSANPMAAITHDRPLYHAMTEYLSGHANPDNVITQIIAQADAASVAQDLGADKEGINLAAEKARNTPLSLAGQLRISLAHLIEFGQIPLNKKGAEGFVDGDALFLMSKPIADRLRANLIERGITSVPSDNSRLFNELQQHQLIRANDDDMAIWKCEVELTEYDWRHTFTFVCVHWPSLVPGMALESVVGSVTPVASEIHSDTPQSSSPAESSVSESVLTDDADVEAQYESAPQQHESLTELSQPADVSQDLMQFFTQVAPQAQATDSQEPVETPDEVESDSTVDITLPAMATLSERPEQECGDALPMEADAPELSPESSILLRKIDLREVKGQALGELFYEWLDAVLCGGVYPVNRQGALFHRVEQGMLVVSPGAFKQFVQERCQFGKPNSYSEVQQGLQPLALHIVSHNGRNVHKAAIKDSHSSLNGFLFEMKPQWQERYAINPHVTLEDV